jgi:hypothetical protein
MDLYVHVVSCFEQGGIKFSRVYFAIPGPKHHTILVNSDMLEPDGSVEVTRITDHTCFEM